MRLFVLFFVLKIEELKNENALLRAQLQQHGIEMVGETPPQWSRDKKNKEGHHHSDKQSTWWKRRRDDGGKNKKDLWRITFSSECIFPRLRTLHRPLVAVLDGFIPIEITTRYNSVEMCSTHHHQSALLAHAMRDNLCWTPPFICIYVASLVDYAVSHVHFNLAPCQCILPQTIDFDLVHAFIRFFYFSSVLIFCFSCFNLLVRLLTEASSETSYSEARTHERSRLNFKWENIKECKTLWFYRQK